MIKLLVVETAALGFGLWRRENKSEFWKKLNIRPLKTVFPALTCPAQASFRTALSPSNHGMIANGFFDRKLCKTFFWEQSSDLYDGERIWREFREKGGTVGQICWQQSIGPDSDMILSPAPIHKHHGGIIQDVYSEPDGLYSSLCEKIGGEFDLFSYWGPRTSSSPTKWIVEAASELLVSNEATDLLFVYLPYLDYDLQKYGVVSDKIKKTFIETEIQIEKLFVSAKLANYEVIIFGDYAVTEAERAIFPNRILWDKGYFTERNVSGKFYPDLYISRAFAMVDHQIAHIYVKDKNDTESVKEIFERTVGVKRVCTHSELNHEKSGDLILEAAPGFWFAYPWWEKKSQAPDYATHVDIHNKPGFDPCELFMSFWPPMSISLDASKVRGTHGSADLPEHEILWASSFRIDTGVETLVGAAEMLKSMLLSQ